MDSYITIKGNKGAPDAPALMPGRLPAGALRLALLAAAALLSVALVSLGVSRVAMRSALQETELRRLLAPPMQRGWRHTKGAGAPQPLAGYPPFVNKCLYDDLLSHYERCYYCRQCENWTIGGVRFNCIRVSINLRCQYRSLPQKEKRIHE